MNSILKVLNNNIRNIISNHIRFFQDDAIEIRLRVNSPVVVKTINGDYF